MKRLVRTVRVIPLVTACAALITACAQPSRAASDLEGRLELMVDSLGAEVSVYYRSLGSSDSATVAADVRMHAASTMKIPVLIQLVLDDQAGLRSLSDRIVVTDRFESIVDGSPYVLDRASDSDTTLYGRTGEALRVRELAELMITMSSNLATNLLVQELGAERITRTLRELGADSMVVLRGVEDVPAFRAGLNNTTTARDLGVILFALGTGSVGSPEASGEMLDILARQHFREMIPAGVPPGTRVANKDGWIVGIRHDAAVVYPPGRPAYVLVVLTRGFEDPNDAEAVAVRISRMVWDYHTGAR